VCQVGIPNLQIMSPSSKGEYMYMYLKTVTFFQRRCYSHIKLCLVSVPLKMEPTPFVSWIDILLQKIHISFAKHKHLGYKMFLSDLWDTKDRLIHLSPGLTVPAYSPGESRFEHRGQQGDKCSDAVTVWIWLTVSCRFTKVSPCGLTVERRIMSEELPWCPGSPRNKPTLVSLPGLRGCFKIF